MPDTAPLLTVLFLSWRCTATDGRSYVFPVGRLVRKIEPSGRVEYEFCYMHGLHEAMAHGMHPVLTFDKPDGVWRSPRLFPLFGSRIMSERRPDYGQFLRDIHVSYESAEARDPLSVMVRSGGVKSTDWYEVFGWPEYEDSRLIARFWLRGLRHRGDAAEIAVQRIGEQLTTGVDVSLEARPEVAETDSKAVAILDESGQHIGFMPRELTSLWHDLCDSYQIGPKMTAVKYNGTEVVPYYRLLCELISPWPVGFVPFASDERFRPISPRAWEIPGVHDPMQLGRPQNVGIPVLI